MDLQMQNYPKWLLKEAQEKEKLRLMPQIRARTASSSFLWGHCFKMFEMRIVRQDC